MATVRSIIQASLRRIGVLAEGEVPQAAQAADGLESLNALLDQWAADRLQVPVVLPVRLPLTNGIGAYRLLPVTADAETADDFDSDPANPGVPAGWTAGPTSGGLVGIGVQSEPSANTAPNLLRLDGSGTAGSASIYKDVVCNAGTRCNLSVWQSVSNLGGEGSLRVQNQDTGLYLNEDGTWGTAVADVFTATPDASVVLVHFTLTFYLDPSAMIGDTLRFSIVGTDLQPGDVFDSDTFVFTNYADLRERPVFIDHANVIDSSSNSELEIPLTILTDDAWALVRQKPLTSSLPAYVYYNPTFPYGTLHVWPVPDNDNLTIILYAAYPITKFGSTTNTFYLPPGYERMIVTNLALELAPEYGAKPSPLLMQQAQTSMDSVKRSNVKMSDMSFPSGSLCGAGRPWYDIRLG